VTAVYPTLLRNRNKVRLVVRNFVGTGEKAIPESGVKPFLSCVPHKIGT